MQCPIDGTPLVITDRSGVEIDYCPKCRGVWLDRGELDKIIERASAYAAPPPPPPPTAQPQRGRGYDDREHDSRGFDPRRKKRKGGMGDLLGDIFDF
ncbi:MAG: zf-TFIIB domain-containing protein [Pseudomonadota bacterium]